MPPKPYIPLALDHYTPVLKSMPVPNIASVSDPPLVCVTFSEKLIPYLLGLLEIYRWPDKLSGTPEQVTTALGVFQDLMALLMEGNCPAMAITDLRINGCNLEVQYNAVNTWIVVGDLTSCAVPGPKGDKGDSGEAAYPYTPPPIPGANTRCNVADYVAAWVAGAFQDLLNQMNYELTISQNYANIAAALVGGIPGAGFLASAMFTAISGIAAIGQAGVQAAFTQQFREDVMCHLYCELGEDGDITQAVKDSWGSDVQGMTNDLHVAYANFIQATPLSILRQRAYFAHDYGGNCLPCDCTDTWEHTFDFTTGTHGWTAYNGWATLQADGWHGVSLTQGEITYMNLYIQLNTAAFALDGVYIEYTDTDVYGSTADMFRAWNEPDRQGNLVANYSDGTGDHANRNHFAAGTDGLDAVGVQSQLFSLSGYSGSTVAVHLIRIYGHGNKPDFE